MLRQAQHGRVWVMALALAACSRSPDTTSATGDAAEHIDCALSGDPDFKLACGAERSAGSLILRHPGGGFRRFVMGEGDNRIRPADGAEAAMWRDLPDGRVEVVVGQDRYRLRLDPEPSHEPSAAVSGE